MEIVQKEETAACSVKVLSTQQLLQLFPVLSNQFPKSLRDILISSTLTQQQ